MWWWFQRTEHKIDALAVAVANLAARVDSLLESLRVRSEG